MKVLLLGPARPRVETFLASVGDMVHRYEDRLTANSEVLDGVDFIVSYGYRHLIKEDVIKKFPRRIINLHISFLPFNRGADPNLWSFLEDTPKGVTIHYIDKGLDTGEILAQKKVEYTVDDTLRTMYDKLTHAIEDLFCEKWGAIRSFQCQSFPQPPGGSYHRLKDKEKYLPLLTQGWDTPVRELIGQALPKVGKGEE